MSAEGFEYANRQSAYAWEKTRTLALGELKLCAALWARYDTELDQGSTVLAEKRTWLKEKAAALVRESNPKAILDDYECRRFVLRVWPGGLIRLQQRVREQA